MEPEKSVPLLNLFKTWLDKLEPNVLPDSLLGIVLSYALDQWGRAIHYWGDRRLNIDNNSSKRAIKLIVMGRSA
ncbi:MAG: transposase [Sinobacterium sp.]